MPHKVAGRSALSAIRSREPAHESGPIEAGHLTHCPSDATRGSPDRLVDVLDRATRDDRPRLARVWIYWLPRLTHLELSILSRYRSFLSVTVDRPRRRWLPGQGF
jgi:hypothetical protein